MASHDLDKDNSHNNDCLKSSASNPASNINSKAKAKAKAKAKSKSRSESKSSSNIKIRGPKSSNGKDGINIQDIEIALIGRDNI